MAEVRLIVGLGNPGEKYRYTRHNWGFLVVEKLAALWDVKFRFDENVQGCVAKCTQESVTNYLLLPQTYMNLSGASVAALANKKSIALNNVLVVCDDLDLPFGFIRIKPRGSAGGHNGLKSIIASTATNEFARLRGGIGKPVSCEDTADFVLDRFSTAEKKGLEEFIQTAVECCQVWVKQGVDEAMSQFNKRSA